MIKDADIIKENLKKARSRLDIGAGHNQGYQIEMKNYYLNSMGAITRKQLLNAEYVRKVEDLPNPVLGLTRYKWQNVRYKDRAGVSSMNWRFAEELDFLFYMYSIEKFEDFEVLPVEWIRSEMASHMRNMMASYDKFPKLPSVYLMIMLTFDVIAFETFACHINSTPELYERQGEFIQLENLSEQQSGIGCGLYSDSSFFQNGKFFCLYRGVGMHCGRLSNVFEYKCDNSKVKIEDQDALSGRVREGRSFYSGIVCLDIESGLPVAGSMLESYIGEQKSRNEDKQVKIPIHIRRNVSVKLLADD